MKGKMERINIKGMPLIMDKVVCAPSFIVVVILPAFLSIFK
jgi:hypothetical protein